MATLYISYSNVKGLELFIDFIIIIDIGINFVSETVKDVIVITYLKESIIGYLKSYFFIDLVSILPCMIFWESNNDIYPLKTLRFLRIKRFFYFFN
jgi:hypothetical protein